MKKFTLDSTALKNYPSISNLFFLSQLIECINANRLQTHLSSHNLFAKFQSSYRKFHSSETALLYVQNNILVALEAGHSTSLLLLDLSAAFDTIDRNIQLIVYNIGSLFHSLFLIFYSLFFQIVIKLSLFLIPNRNQFY